MKTLLIFTAAFLVTLNSIAAGRSPSVTINSNNNFEIVVDGQRYSNDNNIRIDRMQSGAHTIQVYERRRGILGTRRVEVSSKRFFVRDNDIYINVDNNGNLQIDETSNGGDRNYDRNSDRNNDRNSNRDRDRGWNDDNRYSNDNRDCEDNHHHDNGMDKNRGWGNSKNQGHGNGHGKGHGNGKQKSY